MIEQSQGFVAADALLSVGGFREIAGLRVVRITQMGHTEHGSHRVDGGRSYAVVQLSLIAHDGIDEDGGALGGLLQAVTGDNVGLELGNNEAGGYRVERETYLFPNGEHAFDV